MNGTKWAIKLSEYENGYKLHSSAKAQVLAELIIELVHAISDFKNRSKKWKLHEDGAFPKQGSGIGIQLESPKG